MTVIVRCPSASCGKQYKVPSESLGREAVCKHCGSRFTLVAAAKEVSSSIADDSLPAGKGSISSRQRDTAAVAGSQVETARPPGGVVPREVPERIGRFQIRSRLGAGTFGAVYRAYDPLLGREVALKVPHTSTLKSKTAKARFFAEAKAAAKLRHPNIVPVYETGQDENTYFIASAYISGHTLEKSIDAKRLNLGRSAIVVMKLAKALHYAHRLGVVHRDIKPANIMLDRAGEPLLMDFGLARCDSGESRLTIEGALLGTPAYMSPEQAAGRVGEIGPASDQYSLGVVLYELISGRQPFSGRPEVVMGRVINEEPASPQSIDPAIPKDLATICEKAIAKHPSDRYVNCDELADDLRRWLADEPIRARPASGAERAYRWCKRNPAKAGVCAALVLLIFLAAFSIRQKQVAKTSVENVSEFQQQAAAASRELEANKERFQLASEFGEQQENEQKRIRAVAEQNVQTEKVPTFEYVEPKWQPNAENHDKFEKLSTSQSWNHPTILAAQIPCIRKAWSGIQVQLPVAGEPGHFTIGASNVQQAEAIEQPPQRFILRGRVWGVRALGENTWVYIAPTDFNTHQVLQYSHNADFPLFPYLCVIFEGKLTESLCDYRLNDEVDTVVSRTNWGEFAHVQELLAAKELGVDLRARYPKMDVMLATGRAKLAEESLPAIVKQDLGEYRRLASGGFWPPVWCVQGECITKRTQPSTVVYAKHSREGRLSNASSVSRSPGQILRNASAANGMKGVITASFESVVKNSDSDLYTVYLSHDTPEEGTIFLAADIGHETSQQEFFDYEVGQPVQACIEISGYTVFPKRPATSRGSGSVPSSNVSDITSALLSNQFFMPYRMAMVPSAGDYSHVTNPMVFGAQLQAKCLWIQRVDDVGSMVLYTGPRRATMQNKAPDVVQTLDDIILSGARAKGQTLRARGRLSIVFRDSGETHIKMVSQLGSGRPVVIHATSKVPHVLNDLRDYRAEEHLASSRDDFTRYAHGVKPRLGSPNEYDRVGDEIDLSGVITSVLVDSINLNVDMELVELMRAGEPDSIVRVDRRRDPAAIKSDREDKCFALWRDPTVGGVEESVNGYFVDFDNRSGLLTFKFESTEKPFVGGNEFVAYTTDVSFIENLADYRRRRELHGDAKGDFVRVVGTLKPLRHEVGNHTFYDWPILELHSMQRLNDPSSLATVGNKRDPKTFKRGTTVHPLVQAAREGGGQNTVFMFKGTYLFFMDAKEINHPQPNGTTRTFSIAPRTVIKTAELSDDNLSVCFPNATPEMFADYRHGDSVLVNGTCPATSTGEVALDGIDIVRQQNPRSRITKDGRAIPPLDFSESKSIWESFTRGNADRPERDTITMAATFYGTSTKGDKQLLQLYDLCLDSQYIPDPADEVNFEFAPSDESSEFFGSLKQGDELLFEVQLHVQREEAPPPSFINLRSGQRTVRRKFDDLPEEMREGILRRRASDAKITRERRLISVARLGDPDKKVMIESEVSK